MKDFDISSDFVNPFLKSFIVNGEIHFLFMLNHEVVIDFRSIGLEFRCGCGCSSLLKQAFALIRGIEVSDSSYISAQLV